jgi:hypothetical protein
VSFVSLHPRRIVRGVGALVMVDVITGFSVIPSGSLWMFRLGWIRLQRGVQRDRRPFGTSAEIGLAWFGAFTSLPLLASTLYLATRAYRLPKALLLS